MGPSFGKDLQRLRLAAEQSAAGVAVVCYAAEFVDFEVDNQKQQFLESAHRLKDGSLQRMIVSGDFAT